MTANEKIIPWIINQSWDSEEAYGEMLFPTMLILNEYTLLKNF